MSQTNDQSSKEWLIDDSLSLQSNEIVPAFVVHPYQYKNIKKLFKNLQHSMLRYVIINYKDEYILLCRAQEDMEKWKVWENSEMRSNILFPDTFEIQAKYNIWDWVSYNINSKNASKEEQERIHEALENAGVPDEWISLQSVGLKDVT